MENQDKKAKEYHDKKLENQLASADNPLADDVQPSPPQEHADLTPEPLLDMEFVGDGAPLASSAVSEDLPQTIEGAATEQAQEILETPSDDAADADEADSEPLTPEEYQATFETVIEAILFASDEPLSDKKLAEIAESGTAKRVRDTVRLLNKKYKDGGFSFRIEKIAGGYQMMTLPVFHPWISKLIKVRQDNKLSPAALETLAVIAYKQPIIRADIEAIRGVACGEVIRSLMYKGLVKIVGRAEVLGRPILYGTTKKFLDVFGLASLDDLPKVEELKSPEK